MLPLRNLFVFFFMPVLDGFVSLFCVYPHSKFSIVLTTWEICGDGKSFKAAFGSP